MDLDLAGKTVLITGGGSGIGFACAQAFLAERARVAIVGRNADTLQRASAALERSGGSVMSVSADLVHEREAERAAGLVEAAFDQVDILVNCAGDARRIPPHELDEAAWRSGMDAKFMPYMNMCTVVLRRFQVRHVSQPMQPLFGAIVNVIGKGAKAPSDSHLPGGAANAALSLATAGLAQAYGPIGVRINAVHPAAVVTDRLRRRYANAAAKEGRSIEELMREGALGVPLGRHAEPAEVAQAVLFFASARASYLTGANLVMDGAQRPIV